MLASPGRLFLILLWMFSSSIPALVRAWRVMTLENKFTWFGDRNSRTRIRLERDSLKDLIPRPANQSRG